MKQIGALIEYQRRKLNYESKINNHSSSWKLHCFLKYDNNPSNAYIISEVTYRSFKSGKNIYNFDHVVSALCRNLNLVLIDSSQYEALCSSLLFDELYEAIIDGEIELFNERIERMIDTYRSSEHLFYVSQLLDLLHIMKKSSSEHLKLTAFELSQIFLIKSFFGHNMESVIDYVIFNQLWEYYSHEKIIDMYHHLSFIHSNHLLATYINVFYYKLLVDQGSYGKEDFSTIMKEARLALQAHKKILLELALLQLESSMNVITFDEYLTHITLHKEQINNIQFANHQHHIGLKLIERHQYVLALQSMKESHTILPSLRKKIFILALENHLQLPHTHIMKEDLTSLHDVVGYRVLFRYFYLKQANATNHVLRDYMKSTLLPQLKKEFPQLLDLFKLEIERICAHRNAEQIKIELLYHLECV